MADICLTLAKQETERLDTEIEGLQEKIGLHNKTKDAWDTIVGNPGRESQSACQDFAKSEAARLNGEIEAMQQEIRRHTETREAWVTVQRKAGSEACICQSVTFVKGEDGPWHQQQLDKEIETLQERIRLHNQAKDAWDKIVRNSAGESHPACQEVANSETAQLNREIEALQQEISRRLETRSAWDTIMRNAVSESRIYQGAMYVRGWDGKWHLQRTSAPEQAAELNKETGRRDEGNTPSKVNSVLHAIVDVCERSLRDPQKQISPLAHGREQFQSLGL